MKPRKRITRRVPLPRGKPPRARGRDRFKNRRCEPLRKWIREQPCAVAGRLSGFVGRHQCRGVMECAHIQARGVGGPDLYNMIPLCSGAHRWADWSPHRGGIKSFAQQFDLDLAALAKSYTEEWLAGFPAYEAGAPPKEET